METSSDIIEDDFDQESLSSSTTFDAMSTFDAMFNLPSNGHDDTDQLVSSSSSLNLLEGVVGQMTLEEGERLVEELEDTPTHEEELCVRGVCQEGFTSVELRPEENPLRLLLRSNDQMGDDDDSLGGETFPADDGDDLDEKDFEDLLFEGQLIFDIYWMCTVFI
jgi:hypothetical protein